MSDGNSPILFVCQLNMVRSPMAEGLARQAGLKATSCGMEAGELDDLMLSVMREVDIDMGTHHPQSLHDVADLSFSRIIAFSEDSRDAAQAVFGPDIEVELWAIPMPTSGHLDVRAILDSYRSIRTVIANRLKRQF